MLTPFLKYVSEGRVVRRQGDLQRYSFPEIAEKIFISLLALAYIRHSDKNFAKAYGNMSLMYGSFDRVRTSANDLHNMMAVVSGDPEITKKLKNKNQAQALRQRQPVPDFAVRRYLRTFEDDFKFFTQMEVALNVKDYKNLRRAISDYAKLNTRQKQEVGQRMMQLTRAKLPGTDLQRKTQEIHGKK